MMEKICVYSMYTLSIKIVFSYEYYSNTSAVENMCILAEGLKYHIHMRHMANRQVIAECFQLLWQVDPTPLSSSETSQPMTFGGCTYMPFWKDR